MKCLKVVALGLAATALLASACGGSSAGDRSEASQTPEREANGRPLIIGLKQVGGELPLIDPLAGVLVGRVAAGHTPDVILRRVAGELLVSQAFGPGEAQAGVASLGIFGLGDLAVASAIVPLPDRRSYTVYSPTAVLSHDERYLYYGRAVSICPEGGDTRECDERSLGVIDLESHEQVSQAEISVGCSLQVEVDPQSQQSVLVTCNDVSLTAQDFTPGAVRLLRIEPNGSSTELATFPGRRSPNWMKSVLFAGQRNDGTYFAVYNDGAVFNAGGGEAVADLLPAEGWAFGFNTGAMLGHDRYVLASQARFDHGYSSVVVLNAAAPEDFRVYNLPFDVEHLAPIDGQSVALLHGDGFEMSVLDVETGEVRAAMTLPERVEYLSGG